MSSSAHDLELIEAVGKAAVLLCSSKREDPDRDLTPLTDALSSCRKVGYTAFNELCEDRFYSDIIDRSFYALSSSQRLWGTFGAQEALTFVLCLAGQDTSESWSWINSATFSGPGSVMSSAGFSSPAGWRSLVCVADALGRDPISLGMEHSLEEAAESLHSGIKYAALFASRDPFPLEQASLFKPDADVLTVTDSATHVISCARRLLDFGSVPPSACESWLGYLPLSVFDSVVKDPARSAVVSSLSLDPATPLSVLLEAVTTL